VEDTWRWPPSLTLSAGHSARLPVTNQRQEIVQLGPVARFVTGLLDGFRDQRQLTEMVRDALRSGGLSRRRDSDAEDPDRSVQQVLSRLCRSSLVMA